MLNLLQAPNPFGGQGSTLNGRTAGPSSSESKSKQDDKKPAHDWGGAGHTLQSAPPRKPIGTGQVGAGGASVPALRRKQRSPSPEEEHDWGVDDDEVIDIDSD